MGVALPLEQSTHCCCWRWLQLRHCCCLHGRAHVTVMCKQSVPSLSACRRSDHAKVLVERFRDLICVHGAS